MTTEQELSNNIKFEQWNNEQQERYKIKNRTLNFTNELPQIIIGQRISKQFTNDKREIIEYGNCLFKAKMQNGRETSLFIDLPTVIAGKGFKTTQVKGVSKKSIAVILYRSNPDHKKFIDLILELETKSVEHVIKTKDLKPEKKDMSYMKGKFSKLLRFDKDNDGMEDENSDKVYFYLNPLDYENKEDETKNAKMKIFAPYKQVNKDGKEDWTELQWNDVLDKPLSLEIIPKIKVISLYHGSTYSITIKCISIVVTDFKEIEKTIYQENTLKAMESETNKQEILNKFSKLFKTEEPKISEKIETLVEATEEVFNSYSVADFSSLKLSSFNHKDDNDEDE